MKPKTTLDHWYVLKTVVEQGGFHQAADYMGRSQSALSYSINKLQDQLGVQLMEIEGRKARLTKIGELLLEDGKAILGGLTNIEERARSLARGHEFKVHLCVENIISQQSIMDMLHDFRQQFPDTLLEVDFLNLHVMHERYEQRHSDLYVLSQQPKGAFSQDLMPVTLKCVARPDHELAQRTKPIGRKDLALSHAIKCESGFKFEGITTADSSFTSAVYWTFNSYSAVIDAIVAGYGYGWVPEYMVREALAEGSLIPLNLIEGSSRTHMIQLVYQNRAGAGPATHYLAQQLEQKFMAN